MSAAMIRHEDYYVNPAVPTGLLDTICTLLACFANDLAARASHMRTARAARMATAALDAVVCAHQLEAALARLASEVVQ